MKTGHWLLAVVVLVMSLFWWADVSNHFLSLHAPLMLHCFQTILHPLRSHSSDFRSAPFFAPLICSGYNTVPCSIYNDWVLFIWLPPELPWRNCRNGRNRRNHRRTVQCDRSIRLTSQVCKLFETIVRDAIVDHLERNRRNDSQHGCRQGRSCLTNLLIFLNKITRMVDDGEDFDIIYLDFAKTIKCLTRDC